MSETLTLPVLPLDDAVVLPGRVGSSGRSDGGVRAAIEAARVSRQAGKPRVLLVRRVDGRPGRDGATWAAVGTLGVVEREGRLPGGDPAVVVRAVSRVR